MRRGIIDILTILYVLITGVIAPILGAMIEKSNDNIITKSIGYENNETKVYPKIIIDD
jgi:hypothetical protein